MNELLPPAPACPVHALGLALRDTCSGCDGHPRTGQARVARGDVVQREGEPASALHLVVSGLFRELRVTEDGRAIDMRLVRAGDVVGVEALQGGGNYQCSLQALTRGRVCRVPIQQVLAQFQADPTQLAAINRMLVGAVIAMREQLVRLGTRSADERVRSLLVELADANPPGTWIELPVTRDEIGSLLGLDRATVSRALHRMEREGSIGLDGRRYCLKAAGIG